MTLLDHVVDTTGGTGDDVEATFKSFYVVLDAFPTDAGVDNDVEVVAWGGEIDGSKTNPFKMHYLETT